MRVYRGQLRDLSLARTFGRPHMICLLHLEVPDELHPVGYVDDVATLGAARAVQRAQRTLRVVMRRRDS